MRCIHPPSLNLIPVNQNSFILQGLNWRQAAVMLEAKLARLLFPRLFWLACDFTPLYSIRWKHGLCMEIIIIWLQMNTSRECPCDCEVSNTSTVSQKN